MRHLGRLLLAGYGLAAAGGIVAHLAGLGLSAAVLVFWLGGAVAVLVLAVIVAPRMPARAVSSEAEDATLAEALRLWEEDRRNDHAAAAQRQRGGHAAS